MSLKLKLNTGKSGAQDGGVPPTPTPASAAATPGSGGGFKLKLNASQPPTPASEQHATLPAPAPAKKSRAGGGDKSKGGKAGKKRAANDDTITPAAKRLAKNNPNAPQRKFSLKLTTPQAAAAAEAAPQAATGAGRILLKRKSTQNRLRSLNVKRPPPPRLPGLGYDSEDSEAEEDPAIQQAFVLRMEPGEDCEYIRDAIATGKIGLPPSEGPAEVSMRFIDKDFRRAVVTVRGRRYAAVLVDLPCIVETMKSWDRKGWWKVADISQMLLVLGRCSTDDEAKNFPLPRGVDKNNLQYAHGLTPPMHWVRKRRFRKRLSYKTIANVEEEVERLLKEDEQAEATAGGFTKYEVLTRAELERSQEPDDEQYDEEGDAIETVENDGEEYEEYYEDEEGDADLEGTLQAMFDEDHANASSSAGGGGPVTDLVTESPKPLADQAASYTAVQMALQGASDSPATTTERTPVGEAPETTTQDEQSSDEDEQSSDEDASDDDDDEDSPDVLDEDAAAKAAERNQQLEEVADLEREVQAQRRKVENMKNQLLKERAIAQLRTLEEDLRVKRVAVFGVDGEGDGDDEGQ